MYVCISEDFYFIAIGLLLYMTQKVILTVILIGENIALGKIYFDESLAR